MIVGLKIWRDRGPLMAHNIVVIIRLKYTYDIYFIIL